MDNHRFQEVLCPFCNKSYPTRIEDVHNTIVKHNGKTISGWMDICPKCGSWVFVVENDLKGKDLSEYQVVRGHFLTTRPECPCLSVTNEKITFSVECNLALPGQKKALQKQCFFQLNPSFRTGEIAICGGEIASR